LLAFGAIDYRTDQVMKLQPICETLTRIGWQPQVGFLEGINQTIDWLMGKDVHPLKTKTGKTLDFKLPSRF
jgi:dTDP-D-glucose 4,6-dehydratase